jgi:hypothetical protein
VTGEVELVALLHRADWTRLSLSGTLAAAEGATPTHLLSVAPGQRFRVRRRACR